MSVPLCYLCGGSLNIKRIANRPRLVTSRSRHVDCHKAIPLRSRSPVVQEMLRACAEPSYPEADDEMEVRAREIWIVAFLWFLGPQQSTGLASLPPELRITVGKLLPGGPSARAIVLEYNLAKAAAMLRRQEPPPIREEVLLLRMDTTICIRRLQVDGRQYIVAVNERVQTSAGPCDSDFVTFASKCDWTHLVLALDVTGCRSLSLHPPAAGICPDGVWYRVIPRSEFATTKRLICSYRGRTLRDMIDPDNPNTPLFDSVPPFLRLRWFAESPSNKGLASGPQRMMRRTAGQKVTAITVAFFGGATVDVHFHRGNIAETQAFYRSLGRFVPAVILRYAELRPTEHLINVGVRVRRVKLGSSSACLMVCLHIFSPLIRSSTDRPQSSSHRKKGSSILLPISPRVCSQVMFLIVSSISLETLGLFTSTSGLVIGLAPRSLYKLTILKSTGKDGI